MLSLVIDQPLPDVVAKRPGLFPIGFVARHSGRLFSLLLVLVGAGHFVLLQRLREFQK